MTTPTSAAPTSHGSSSGGAPRHRSAGGGGGRPGGAREEGGRGPRRWGPPRRKVCRFCVDRVIDIDFKNVTVLRSFLTERGKIISARSTGNCAKHHRMLTAAIKRARNLALLPYLVVW